MESQINLILQSHRKCHEEEIQAFQDRLILEILADNFECRRILWLCNFDQHDFMKIKETEDGLFLFIFKNIFFFFMYLF